MKRLVAWSNDVIFGAKEWIMSILTRHKKKDQQEVFQGEIVPAPPEKRRCSRCRRRLPMTGEFFYKCKSTPHGFQNYCKTCSYEYSRERAEKKKEDGLY